MRYAIKISFVNPAKWFDPAPFLFTEDYGDPVTFDTKDAAQVMAHLLFKTNDEVTTEIVRSEP